MGNGIQFMGDGPVMQGTWYNPQTGHKFTVRDCFFQDGQFIVQTTDGQMLDYNTVQNYVQATDAQGKEVADRPIVESTNPVNDLPPEVANLVEEFKPQTTGYYQLESDIEWDTPGTIKTSATTIQTQEDPDTQMVSRVLKRFDVPEVDFSIDSNKFPKKQIETLVDILGIDPDVIVEYYINKLDVADVIENIKESFKNRILSLIEGEVEKPVIKEEPKKPANKKSTRNVKKK